MLYVSWYFIVNAESNILDLQIPNRWSSLLDVLTPLACTITRFTEVSNHYCSRYVSVSHIHPSLIFAARNTCGGRGSTVQLTSCLTCLDQSVSQMKTKIVSCHTTDSKPVKQEVNITVIHPPFSAPCLQSRMESTRVETLTEPRVEGSDIDEHCSLL